MSSKKRKWLDEYAQYGFTCIKEQRKYVLKKSYFIFPITKGSVNALMKLAGFRTSNKVKNHWFNGSSTIEYYRQSLYVEYYM